MATVASGAATFRWTIPPDAQLIPRVQQYGKDVLDAIHAVAGAFASQMQAAMRSGAPWHDQSGAARQGLTAVALTSATGFVIAAFHTVYYGVFLEWGTIHMAPRAIVGPTRDRFAALIMQACARIVGA